MTNKQRFRARIANLQEKGFDIGFDNAFGGDAITSKDESKNLSRRGNPGQLLEVLAGVEAGIALERQRIAAKYPHLIHFLKECELRNVNCLQAELSEIGRFLKGFGPPAVGYLTLTGSQPVAYSLYPAVP